MDTWSFFSPRQHYFKLVPLMTPPPHLYFLPMPIPLHQLEMWYPIKFFQHQFSPLSLRSLPSLLCLLCPLLFTLQFLLHTSRGLVKPRLLCASTVVLNHRDIFHFVLDCCVLDSLHLAIFSHSLTILDIWSHPWGLPNYWDFADGMCPPPPLSFLYKLEDQINMCMKHQKMILIRNNTKYFSK